MEAASFCAPGLALSVALRAPAPPEGEPSGWFHIFMALKPWYHALASPSGRGGTAPAVTERAGAQMPTFFEKIPLQSPFLMV